MARISRRGLLRSGAAAGVLAATGMPLMAMPQRGGRFRAGLSGANTSDSWDSRTHSDLFMIASAHGAVFDCLTEVSADGSLRGELAESWEASADAKIWTFNLRKGVRFHNGKGFGADDVIASLQLHVQHGVKSAAKPIVTAISEMRKITDHQVQFSLLSGNADFPYLMSDYHLVMYPAGQIEEAIAKGVGTGLYAVVSFEPGVRMRARRVEDHYKGDNAGWFDDVEYIAINDSTARTNALLTGQVDAINRIDFKSEGALRANPNTRIQEVTGNQHYTFPMLSKSALFGDLNVRRALQYGVNRQELVDKILFGHGEVANDSPIGPANQYYASDMEQIEYDLDKSKFYLKRAGLASIDIDLSVANAAFEGASDAAQLYRSTAKPAGINITAVREPDDGYWTNTWSNKSWCTSYCSGRATEDWIFSTSYAAGAAWNDTEWNHPRFQSLLVSARAELDSNNRRDQYREMQEILRADVPVIIPMFANYVQALSSKIATTDVVGNLLQMDNGRMAERWWIA